MTVNIITDDTTIPGKLIVKFESDLPAGSGQDSTTWICPPFLTNISYLIVGGGGKANNGGGGAGTVITGTLDVTPGTQYTVKIGRGASSGTGGTSEFNNITANGGNAGSNDGGASGSGYPGGSSCYWSGTLSRGYGGGGGAGGPGANGNCSGGNNFGGRGGNGGIGVASDITGTSIYYGGGGGGNKDTSGQYGSPGAGAIGGGGNYTGNGANGIVILQYEKPPFILVRELKYSVTGNGNLLVMESEP